MQCQSNKRKRVVISLQEKLKAVRRLDNGELLKNIAKDLGVGVSTVAEWRKNREKLEKWCSVLSSPTPARKSMKRGEYEKVDDSLFLWFTQNRERGIPISGTILKQKAVSLSEELPVIEAPESFSASDGWLDRWKKRHGVRQLKVCGEKLSADVSAAKKFAENFMELMKENDLQPDQIYNCDETGLNYKMLPSSTLASKTEAGAPGYKRSKERITVLACANASGRHKLPLLCIGKSAKPRAFKNIRPNAFPVLYKNQKKGWMNANLFKNWFFEDFVPKVESFLKEHGYPRKCVLLLDNAPTHPSAEQLESGEIKAMFLPPAVTSLIQPMDQGVLENLKRNYRRLLLEHILEEVDEGANLTECLKKLNLKNVVYWIASAWNQVKGRTLQKSWSKLIQHEEGRIIEAESDHEESLQQIFVKIPGCENVTESEVNEWLNSDNVEDEMTDQELIESVCKNANEISSDDDDEVECTDNIPVKMSHSEGLEALEKALTYVEQQENATAADVLLIKRWRDIAAKNRSSAKRVQLKITSFLNSKV